MLRPSSFRIDGEVIRITNCQPRGQSVALFVIALAMLAVPVIQPHLPDGIIEPRVTKEHLPLVLFGVFLCSMAAFWWSVVVIDRQGGYVEIVRRWGLFTSRRRRPLPPISAVVVKSNSDNDVSVYLQGLASENAIELNNDLGIVWGRSYVESLEIARSISEHLQVRLDDHCWTGRRSAER